MCTVVSPSIGSPCRIKPPGSLCVLHNGIAFHRYAGSICNDGLECQAWLVTWVVIKFLHWVCVGQGDREGRPYHTRAWPAASEYGRGDPRGRPGCISTN